jgi:gliding motility-associated-like protein
VLLIAATLQIAAQSGSSAFEFTENKGQWDKQVRFKGEVGAGAFYLQKNGFTVVQHNGDDLNNFFRRHHKVDAQGGGGGGISRPDRGPNSKPEKPGTRQPAPTGPLIRSHAYRVQFLGGDENSVVVPDKQVQTNTSYFIGNDPSKWAVNVSVYQAIVYKNIYPNIDIRYYSEYGRLKYDLIVHPGGEVSNIAMKYEGADKLSVKNNELIIKTSVGELKELYPYTYQFDMTTGKKEVACNYELVDKNTVKFRVANYSKTSTLVIDPTLVFCSFTGSPANQYGYTATPGPDGSLYSGGIVFGSGFPTTPGAYQTGYVGGDDVGTLGGIDMGIFKFTPDGRRSYATYLGGNRNDYPHSLIVDGQGNLVVMGKTYSSNWPGAVRGTGGGADIAVAKLNANGTGLIGALRIGGGSDDGVNIKNQIEGGGQKTSTVRFYGDDSRSEVILDNNNNIYIAAQTQSTSGGNLFPVTAGAFQTTPGGLQDGVVIKINPSCNDIIWASFLGGAKDDGAFVLALNPLNNELYVGGATTDGTGFPPANKTGAYQPNFHPGAVDGVADGFVSRISNNGATIINTTFLGTTFFDAVYGLKFDKAGIPYAMGVTEGAWPVLNAAYSIPNSKQFIVKIKPDLSDLIYSTVFGNGSAKPNISPVAFLVDRCENIYISGWGGWLEPGSNPYQMDGVANMPTTPDAIKLVTDNRDFYFIVIKRDAAGLLYGSYFGQSGGEGEHVDGGTSRYDAQGVIYQAICANCFGSRPENPITQSFPTTPGVWAERNGSPQCNLAAVKIAFNFAGVASGPKAFFNNRPDTVGCVPFTLQFRDTVRNAKSYEWDFDGDGVTDRISTNFEETFTFNTVGTYRVRLIAVDPTTCNQRDTAYVTIRVRDDPAVIDFDAVKDGPCESLGFNFINKSTHPAGKPFGATSFAWDFGDGTPIVPTNTDPVKHYFTAPGTYPIRLILLDTNYCNGGDWKQVNLGVVANVEARVETPKMGCAPYDAYFNNTSLGGHDYLWDFGDGTTSTEMSPTHRYDNIGTYNIRMIVIDSNTCNKRDTLDFSIVVHIKPTAAFSVTPIPPLVNKPTIFLNQSIGGKEFHWFFGDEDSTKTFTMENVTHQYNTTGKFTAKLIAYNEFGCTDTALRTAEALIDPLLDVPNAFTPGRGNKSSIVKVAGFGIGKMTWRIYNRWGQKVFETTNRSQGWDGTYQGKLQPMDVYTYTLDVVFTDGKPLRKTGDITLIR